VQVYVETAPFVVAAGADEQEIAAPPGAVKVQVNAPEGAGAPSTPVRVAVNVIVDPREFDCATPATVIDAGSPLATVSGIDAEFVKLYVASPWKLA